MNVSMFFAGLAIAFIKGWLMAVVLLSTIPALIIGGGLYVAALTQSDEKQKKDYAEAGGRA